MSSTFSFRVAVHRRSPGNDRGDMRALSLVGVGSLLAATCRAPTGRLEAVTTPPREPRGEMVLEAGAGPDAGASDSGPTRPTPEDVSIEQLIAAPALYFGKPVRTEGWVVSCAATITCSIPCERCSMCVSRAAMVPPGTAGMAACERNGDALIIMDLETLNKFVCAATSCADSCARPCPFPHATRVQAIGTIRRANEYQIGFGDAQYVLVPDTDPVRTGDATAEVPSPNDRLPHVK